jgi:SAM-dependent methyltransferase
MLLNEVVPWGRSLAEYQLIFDLSEADLGKNILGCGDGPASFNSEMTAAGRRVVSIDPIYAFSPQEIQNRIEETCDTIISQVKQNPHRYLWTYFQDPDDLGRARLSVMRDFLQDFEIGLAVGRYLPAALPSLPFQDAQFDLCLCSHLLFLYSEQLSLEFHLASIQELLRVAGEVRLFPLLGLDCQPSPHLVTIQEHFEGCGYNVKVRPVPYEFQRGGNQMMTLQGGQT